MNTLIDRLNQPTPKFFQKLRNAGMAMAAIGATIIGVPMALPAILVKIAGYLTLAGGVMSSVSQAAVKDDNE